MPKQRTFVGSCHFDFSRAQIVTCKKCSSQWPVSTHANVLVRHLKREHPADYEKTASVQAQRPMAMNDIRTLLPRNPAPITPTQVSFTMTKEEFEKYAVMAVTTGGRPLCVFETPGIKEIVKGIAAAVGVNVSSPALKNLIFRDAENFKKKIAQQTIGKMISVKIDLCTKSGRHFLGTNIQFVKEGVITLYTAGVTEMKTRATGEAVRETMRTTIERLGFEERQIYSLTTDNGSNVLKTAELVRQDAGLMPEDPEDEDEEDAEEVTIEIDSADGGVVSVRCAAHTLQLAINDILRNKYVALLQDIRRIVRKTHAPSMRIAFVNAKAPLPKLDCLTRWGSTLAMILSVIRVRVTLDSFALANPALQLTNEDWEAAEMIAKCLKPPEDLSLKLQQRNITAGEFLGELLFLIFVGLAVSSANVHSKIPCLWCLDGSENKFKTSGRKARAFVFQPRPLKCSLFH